MNSRCWILKNLSALVILVAFGVFPASGRAHDIPNQILVEGFVKPQGDRLHFVARIPLVMLLNMNLPKRGPGYLDLAHIDKRLQASADATARGIQLFENQTRLIPIIAETRVSQPSDRSFETYDGALANIRGPKLPDSTNVFWNQGYFDVHLAYPIHADRSDFSLDMQLAPGLSGRLKMIVRFLPPDGTIRAYEIHGGFGRLALDPRWYQAARTFVYSGFFHILDGTDHLLFLFCLVIPFYRRWWDLLKIITSFTVAHSITLIASAEGLVPAGNWFPPLVETLIALSIFYMAVENVVAANLRRRWLITGVFGLVHGFGFSWALQQQLQFAGDHLLLSLMSFNIGVELGQLLVLLVTIPALGLLFQYVMPQRVGTVILSVLIAHTSWHWMLERAQRLRYVEWPTVDVPSIGLLRADIVRAPQKHPG